MKLLRFALTFNSLFSFCTGIILLIGSVGIAELFGIEEPFLVTLLGIGLIIFSITLFIVNRQNPIRPLPVFVIICLDLLWIAASVILLILQPVEFTQTGTILIGVIAFIVLLLALLQTYGLLKVDKNSATGHKELIFHRTVSTDTDTTWDLISNVANYHHVAPNIDYAEILSGKGEGMVRRCSQGKESWTEKCTQWIEGEQFSFHVNTEDPNYPYPLNLLQGTWKVVPGGDNESRIELKFEFQYSKKIFNLILHPFMAQKFRGIVHELLDNWDRELTSGKTDTKYSSVDDV